MLLRYPRNLLVYTAVVVGTIAVAWSVGRSNFTLGRAPSPVEHSVVSGQSAPPYEAISDTLQVTPPTWECIDTAEKAIARVRADVGETVEVRETVARLMLGREFFAMKGSVVNYDYVSFGPDDPVWVVGFLVDPMDGQRIDPLQTFEGETTGGMYSYGAASGEQFFATTFGEHVDDEYYHVQQLADSDVTVDCP